MERHGSKSGGAEGGESPTQTQAPYLESRRIATEEEVGGCLRGRPLQVASALAANVISLSFGSTVGYPSAILNELKDRYSTDEISWIITVSMIGAFFGSGAWSQLTPRLGPKRSVYLSGIPMLISWCLLLNFDDFWFTIAGRLISGIGMGALATTVPHYVNDITEDALRGTLGSIMVLGFNSGTLFVYALGFFFKAHQVTIVCAVIPAVFLVVFLPCPESPIYLLEKGHDDHGRHNLKRLRYPKDINHELASINSKSEVQTARWADLYKKRAARKTLVISLGMFAVNQVTGIIPLLSYVSEIFDKAGGAVDPITGSCIVAVVQIFGSLIGMFLIDRVGRRILMMSSCLGMAIGHGSLGYSVMPGNAAPGWLAVTSLSCSMVAFSIGAASAPFVIMNELSSPSMRPKIAGVNMFFNGILTFAITKTYSDLTGEIGMHGVFWTYAGGCVMGILFTFFFLPETNGRSNASLQEELEGRRIRPIL